MPDACNIRILCAIAAFCFLYPAQAEEKPTVAPGRTEISEVPWKPEPADSGKVIYGTDDRHDVFEETDPARVTWAASTCALVDQTQLTDLGDGTFSLRLSGFRYFELLPCEGEPFRNQPAAAYCTGFVVGPDLIATAGHCYGDADLANARFVFGFQMLDANTPKSTFDASEVYAGVEVVAHQLEGDYDYAVVRVDRPITAPGAEILPLRSAGTVPSGTKVGIIGHPLGLPAKIAFGDATMVRSGGNPGYFVANLDSFGGNSGSPVFNAETGVVEGILVRGEQDIEFEEDCFRSNALANTGGLGEQSSKASTFAKFVQFNRGALTLDRAAYPCDGTVNISLFDYDLDGAGSAEVTLFTSGGDFETLELVESGQFGTFSGSIDLASGDAAADSGAVETAEDQTIFVTYRDDDVGTGAPGDSVATARVDCTPPVISDVSVERAAGNHARIAFTTNEPAAGIVFAGLDCANPATSGEGELVTAHSVEVAGLDRLTDYLFYVTAVDPAGNTATDDNGGACYTFSTTGQRDYFAQQLTGTDAGLEGQTLTFVPDSSTSGYSACLSPAAAFPVSPFCGEPLLLDDDNAIEYTLGGGRTVRLYGTAYSSFFVNANGSITFGTGDETYLPSLEQHFTLPRISGLFADIYPPGGGQISVTEEDDRVAVSYFNVVGYFNGIQSFQVELFYDGTIRITWTALTAPYGVVGLSRGGRQPADFEESVLAGFAGCGSAPAEPVECDTSVPNDACGDAITAAAGETYTGLTFAATGSNSLSGCEFCYDPDVWFTFKPPATGTYTLALCGSSFDTVLDVFKGSCGNLQFVIANDDACGYQSAVVTDLNAGETYRIRISGYFASTGNYEFTIYEGTNKAIFGCNAGGGVPANPYADVALLAGIVAALAWRLRRKGTCPRAEA